MDELELAVGGQIFSGWESVELVRSMEAVTPEFSVSHAQAWAQWQQPFPINAGDSVELRYRGAPIVRGYIDDDALEYDDSHHSMSVNGRARTGDLVDCAAEHRGGEWLNATVLNIATDLCRPFGIEASIVGASAGAPFARFALQSGETVQEALERACRMRGLLLQTDNAGDLVLTRATTSKRSKTVLEWGKNVRRGSRRTSWRERFSRYTVKAQVPGSDTTIPDQAAGAVAMASDAEVKRYRPRITMAEGEDSGAELEKRVLWERNVRPHEMATPAAYHWRRAE